VRKVPRYTGSQKSLRPERREASNWRKEMPTNGDAEPYGGGEEESGFRNGEHLSIRKKGKDSAIDHGKLKERFSEKEGERGGLRVVKRGGETSATTTEKSYTRACTARERPEALRSDHADRKSREALLVTSLC